MRRLDKGAPIRAAMKAAGLDIPSLAAETKRIDTGGEGLSRAYVGFITGGGKTARDECSDRAAELIATALKREVTDLFEPVVFALTESTSTRMTHTRVAVKPLPDRLMDQRELCDFLRKSPSWIDRQIQGGGFPVEYVGRSRRFDPHAVLKHLRKQRAAAQTAA